MYHRPRNTDDSRSQVDPLYLSYIQLEQVMNPDTVEDCFEQAEADNFIAWIGNSGGVDYFVCHLKEKRSDTMISALLGCDVRVAGLREFGDRLSGRLDAAVLATANGLVEFHKSHRFCSLCGSRTKSAKAGACRKCISCKNSVYPRIDVAAIMLITSPCLQYALLGRKKMWPQGRWSTLAGFCEVGETMEQCCAREVLEESGVEVELGSIRWVCSQPWPFPRSLMAGFRGIAKQTDQDLPRIQVDENELQDARWFHKDFVRERLQGGSTALGFKPNEKEQEFHVPGPSSLARLLIAQWATED
jgi:NAD+ diphosphatase